MTTIENNREVCETGTSGEDSYEGAQTPVRLSLIHI